MLSNIKKNIDIILGVIIIIFLIYSWTYIRNNVLRKNEKDIQYVEIVNEKKIIELQEEIKKLNKEKDSILIALHEKDLRISLLLERRKKVKEEIIKKEEIKTDKELKDAIYYLRNIR